MIWAPRNNPSPIQTHLIKYMLISTKDFHTKNKNNNYYKNKLREKIENKILTNTREVQHEVLSFKKKKISQLKENGILIYSCFIIPEVEF